MEKKMQREAQLQLQKKKEMEVQQKLANASVKKSTLFKKKSTNIFVWKKQDPNDSLSQSLGSLLVQLKELDAELLQNDDQKRKSKMMVASMLDNLKESERASKPSPPTSSTSSTSPAPISPQPVVVDTNLTPFEKVFSEIIS